MESTEPKPNQQPVSPPPAAEAVPPKDALSKSNEELASGQPTIDTTHSTGSTAGSPEAKPPKKLNPLKKYLKKVDIYLAAFILVAVVAGAFTIVSYLNSRKVPKAPTLATQQLTQNALKALSGSNSTIDNAAQTLTVEGNAIFSNQVLIRGALNVAGAIQSGVGVTSPTLTATTTANLANTQINTLQVAANTTIQGLTSLKDLTVSGTSTFSQAMTASQITVTTLIMSGNAVLQIPNHIAFTGPTPARSAINTNTLGAGGTASVNGSDTTGTININSGNNPIVGCFITLTFAQPFAKLPHVLLSPVNAAGGQLQYYATVTTTGFSLCTDNAAASNQVFAFDYFITS